MVFVNNKEFQLDDFFNKKNRSFCIPLLRKGFIKIFCVLVHTERISSQFVNAFLEEVSFYNNPSLRRNGEKMERVLKIGGAKTLALYISDRDIGNYMSTCTSVYKARDVIFRERLENVQRIHGVKLIVTHTVHITKDSDYFNTYASYAVKRWAVFVIYNRNFTIGQAVKAISRAINASTISTLSKIMPIGNPLLGGGMHGVSKGIVFRGTRWEADEVARKIVSYRMPNNTSETIKAFVEREKKASSWFW